MKVDTITIYTICTDDTVPDILLSFMPNILDLRARTLFYSMKPFKL